MQKDLSFTPASAYRTLPFPDRNKDLYLDNIGCEYEGLRNKVSKFYNIGFTELYNRFHDADCSDELIEDLRCMHKKMDLEVARSYGWGEVELDHGFYELDYLNENDQVRFTISEKARSEVLDRLTLLNKQRFDEEQKEVGSVHVVAGTKYRKISSDDELDKVAEPKPQMDIFNQE